MARRIKQSTLGGFKCDATGCDDNALYAPIIVVPYKDQPARPPIINFTDIHVCPNHWRNVRSHIDIDQTIREACRATAAHHGGVPDFDKASLSRIKVFDPDFHSFQIMMKLIDPEDRKWKPGMSAEP